MTTLANPEVVEQIRVMVQSAGPVETTGEVGEDIKRFGQDSQLRNPRCGAGVCSVVNAPEAAELRGFGPIGVAAILVILAGNFLFVPLSAVLVLLWARWSCTPWSAIGYVRPSSWARTVVIGVVSGAAFKLLMKSIVMPLLGADPINHPYHYLVGNRSAIAETMFLLIVGAGFGEETLFRGYMFERLRSLFGSGVVSKALTVFVTSILFAAGHYANQGIAGVEQAAITGLVFGTVFAITGRIWTLIIAHAAFDLAAYAIIYWDLERQVAHLVFK